MVLDETEILGQLKPGLRPHLSKQTHRRAAEQGVPTSVYFMRPSMSARKPIFSVAQPQTFTQAGTRWPQPLYFDSAAIRTPETSRTRSPRHH